MGNGWPKWSRTAEAPGFPEVVLLSIQGDSCRQLVVSNTFHAMAPGFPRNRSVREAAFASVIHAFASVLTPNQIRSPLSKIKKVLII